ncbi:Gag-Pol polyprotein [Labeo rohita]|uniref:Gag-Pol polyprotein n=1 Tax=Labeo rohita TaxID=84645 RepID=A0ABQ8KZL8_LABRO|nr:Gag-Pol polyprotein [Labeo rohita]
MSSELLSICLALQWVEEIKPYTSVICTDSMAALTSLQSGKSDARQDILYEILQSIYRIRQLRLLVYFLWVPAHIGIEGSECVDQLAKKTLEHAQVELQITISKSEIKRLIYVEVEKKWQKIWENESKGRHLFKIQECVGKRRVHYGNRRKEVILSRLRIGHIALNNSLYMKQVNVINVKYQKRLSMCF